MKHGTKELLKTILHNQELIMKALNIEPVKKDAGKTGTADKADKKKSISNQPAKTSTGTAAKAATKPAVKSAAKKVAKKTKGN